MLLPQTNKEDVAEIPVNPAVLKWARTIRGLTVDAAAVLLGITISELEDYEHRRRKPTVTMLRRMSQKYRINLAGLLMPQPLDDADIRSITDFRISGHGAPGLEASVAIQDIRDTLETMADLKSAAPGLFAAGRIDSIRPAEQAFALAARQRAKFRVTIKQQLDEWQSDAIARERWRQEIESRGIFVYFRHLGKECSGFTVKHDGLFAICVNDSDTTNGRRIFTLLHEFCHVLRRQTGISDENVANPVERYCNRFASAFLVPSSALATRIGDPSGPREFSVGEVTSLAKRFKVSTSAMALRLEHLDYATPGLFDRVDRIVKSAVRPEPDPTKRIHIDPVATQARRLGARHTRITLDALKRGVINAADAQGLLGIDPGRFAALRSATE